MAVIHVSKKGNDRNEGSALAPFLTIQRAADLASAGDTVIVHEGEYREWVKPRNSGKPYDQRITYEAAEGEHVIIKGSEIVSGWEPYCGNVWKVVVPNTVFGDYNPFAIQLMGDWVVEPFEHPVHLGDVYLNGKSLYEARTIEELKNPVKRIVSPYETWGDREEKILEPEQTLYVWYAEIEDDRTIIYANFQDIKPNEALTEISVRRSCFYPDKTGINYITVRGFEMAQAASPWAPPTADQPGLIGPNWSKGWIIENNDIHDAKCSGISLGKEASTGDNYYTKWNRKPGYQYQMEAVFLARHIGWSKERIGSHIVRRNKIHDCGQNGIVGHMGCAFSQIYENEIYRIAVKHEFYGHEIAGIKFHAAIDVRIHHNYIHNCTLGTWLDWQAQGARVSCNIYDQNNRDFMIEVTHGPCLVDNNIFTSAYAFDNAAQGTAFVHNLCCGFHNHYPVLNRATPYHLPHSTQILGTTPVYGYDDRWYQNIFIGGEEENRSYGTADYDDAPASLEEYIKAVKAYGHGDVELFEKVKQPAYINGNAYFNGARAFEREKERLISDVNPDVKMISKEDGLYLQITLPEEFFQMQTRSINTEILGCTRLTEEYYENPDGSAITVSYDLLGKEMGAAPIPGPIQSLRPGRNEVKVY